MYTVIFRSFFFNDTATTEIYTLSLHDALPIYPRRPAGGGAADLREDAHLRQPPRPLRRADRPVRRGAGQLPPGLQDRKSTRLNSSHANISYAVFCLKKKKKDYITCG